jgi:hypothetical protein
LLALQNLKTPYMIRMLMGEQDGRNLCNRTSKDFEAAAHRQGRNANVHQQGGTPRANQGGIA